MLFSHVGISRGRAFTLIALAVVAFAFASLALAPAARAATFDPEFILSDSQLRDVDSMTQAEVQAFLDGQPGALKTLVAPDHNGMQKKASEIIYDACRAYNISPKVMLALLQKENSLITNPSPSARVLERAVGAGCPDSVQNKYPGFGNQIWNGARLLDGYGEGKSTSYIPLWHAGTTYQASNVILTPKNLATFKLYVYNPVIGAQMPYGDLSSQVGELRGNASFWHVYRRYFGDPTAAAKPRTAPTPKKTSAVKKSQATTSAKTESQLHRLARYEGVTFIVSQRAVDVAPDYYVYPVQGEGGHLNPLLK